MIKQIITLIMMKVMVTKTREWVHMCIYMSVCYGNDNAINEKMIILLTVIIKVAVTK